jgi:hypothetical protein
VDGVPAEPVGMDNQRILFEARKLALTRVEAATEYSRVSVERIEQIEEKNEKSG